MNLPNIIDAKKRTTKKVEYTEFCKSQNSFGVNKKYLLKTYGCQMNEHDSENIKGLLDSAGFSETSLPEEADLILLNTCAIRENAHNKVFGLLGRIKHMKEYRSEVIVGICGCMAQEESVTEEILNKYKWIDFVIGTHNIDDLLNVVESSMNEKKLKIEVYSHEGEIIEGIPVKRDSKYSAWVNIQLGCDKFCTYCVVPYTRGKQRSRTKESIINEIENLKNDGYREVTLLGQNVNAYGKDLYTDYDLSNLLEDAANTGIDRIRFVTSHPWDFTDNMIEIISKYKNVMPYIHLPVQSGSNRILKLMGRRYTKESYIELFNKIKFIPNVSVTTDVIVGFPGETDEDFNETLDLVNTCKFDGAFTFIYSPREGTPAAKMDNQISESIKKSRLKELNTIVNKYSNEANKKLLGTVQKCLVLGLSEKDNTKVYGYTENMKLVNIEAPISTIGSIINVEITDAKSFSLDGKEVREHILIN